MDRVWIGKLSGVRFENGSGRTMLAHSGDVPLESSHSWLAVLVLMLAIASLISIL